MVYKVTLSEYEELESTEKRNVLREYILGYCKEHQFPEEAKNHILGVWEKLQKHPELKVFFFQSVDQFFKDGSQDYHEVFNKMRGVSEQIGVHEFSLNLLYLICASFCTKELYQKAGLDHNVLYDSLEDFKIAMFECHMLYNIWGTHYGRWQLGFCNLKLIRFGRLEFGLSKLRRSYEEDIKLLKGQDVIEVHVPSGSPLDHDQCLASYTMAETYYRRKFSYIFEHEPIPFFLASWFLYSPMKEALEPNGNIVKFINDYNIIFQNQENNDSDLWRVFGADYREPVESYSEDTRLQRSLKKWLLSGNHLGYGHGIMFFKEGKFFNEI